METTQTIEKLKRMHGITCELCNQDKALIVQTHKKRRRVETVNKKPIMLYPMVRHPRYCWYHLKEKDRETWLNSNRS